MLIVHRSNRVERLAEALAENLRQGTLSPFTRECIVVQGPGMERWLSMQLARAFSVWANPWFPFPRTLLELTTDEVLGPAALGAERYREGALTLQIASLLPELCERPELATTRAYLDREPRDDSLLSLARTLARALDQHQIHRPDRLFAWETGAGSELAAVVWRALVARLGPEHFARRLARAREALAAHVPLSTSFPQRISVFGISTLPPSFLEALALVGRQRDVHFYLLSACREYQGDLDRHVARGSDLASLLANLATPSRELGELLERFDYHEPERDLYVEPRGSSLLSGLLHDLLDLTRRSRDDPEAAPPRVFSALDTSLTVHRCHSPLREIEVLRDLLRARFEADPSLLPEEVVVLAPDIERYAAAIESTLAHDKPGSTEYLPYRISDRRSALSSDVGRAFFALLNVLSSRFYLSAVLDLLELPAIRERAGVDEGQLETFRGWLERAGARWGEDASHRTEEGASSQQENTLRFALDRLLLGYAAPDGSHDSYADVLPHSEVEGSAGVALGLLAGFLERLFTLRAETRRARALADWPALLARILGEVDDRHERAVEHRLLRGAIGQLLEQAQGIDVPLPLSLRTIARELECRIGAEREGQAFLSHGVTFCEHVPMRAIPFRVVCMVGLDDESFPRRVQRAAFDPFNGERRLGDRSSSDDDKQLFLDALLSARDAVILTYPGRSPKDDSLRPASVVVEQLLRVVDGHFVVAGRDGTLDLLERQAPSRTLVHDHALLRFDPRYFRKGAALVSYDARAAALASAARGEKQRPSFAARPLAARSEEDRDLTVDELVFFFRSPARAFLERRLGLALPRDLAPMPDREPLALDALERYRIGAELLEGLSSLTVPDRERVLRQRGELPPGTLGRYAFGSIERMVEQIEQTPPLGQPTRLRVSYRGTQGRISGELAGILGNVRVERLYSQLGPKHRLAGWIRHLCLQAAAGMSSAESTLIARDQHEPQVLRFVPEPRAGALLDDLLTLYTSGMRLPLPFFVDTSFLYADARHAGKSHDEALTRASKATLATQPGRGSEVEDPHIAQCFGHLPLHHLEALTFELDGEIIDFCSLALRIYEPLLDNLARSRS